MCYFYKLLGTHFTKKAQPVLQLILPQHLLFLEIGADESAIALKNILIGMIAFTIYILTVFLI